MSQSFSRHCMNYYLLSSRGMAYSTWPRILVEQQCPFSRAFTHSPIQSVTHTNKEALTLLLVCWSCCTLHWLGNLCDCCQMTRLSVTKLEDIMVYTNSLENIRLEAAIPDLKTWINPINFMDYTFDAWRKHRDNKNKRGLGLWNIIIKQFRNLSHKCENENVLYILLKKI